MHALFITQSLSSTHTQKKKKDYAMPLKVKHRKVAIRDYHIHITIHKDRSVHGISLMSTRSMAEN